MSARVPMAPDPCLLPCWASCPCGHPAQTCPSCTQLWTPPTPPQDDNDIYIDSVMCLMYETTPIPESKLPPVYVRKERRRHKTDPSGGLVRGERACGCRWPRLPSPWLFRSPPWPTDPLAEAAFRAAAGRKKKQRHGEAVVPPRSLFDRATPGMLKIRREGKEQKKNILLKQQTQFAKPLPTFAKPTTESGPDNPEWLISEDWALLQVSPRSRPWSAPSLGPLGRGVGRVGAWGSVRWAGP